MTSRSDMMPTTLPPFSTGTAPIRRSASKPTASRTGVSHSTVTTSSPLLLRMAVMLMGAAPVPVYADSPLDDPMARAQREAMPHPDPIPPRPSGHHAPAARAPRPPP